MQAEQVEPLDATAADDVESRVVDIALSGRLSRAGTEAIENHRRLGLPLTVSRDNKMVRLYPDGRGEVLEALPTITYVRPPSVRLWESK